MTKAELFQYLSSVPDNAEMFVCVGSRDAWPLRATVFQESDAVIVYCDPDHSHGGMHRNVPEFPPES